ncbi:MAG: DNRLRE domain-containing protein [Calditrichaeota bacterium]|nr:MAG: DNRLRE domain-containing protein [Calditrichota bacterium]
MKHNYAGIGLLLGILLLIGCSETVDLQSDQVLEPGLEGEFVVDTLYATFDTTYHLDTPLRTTTANRLLLGSEGPFTCRVMMKFGSLPINARIFSARLRLIAAGASNDQQAPFTITAYPILQDWNSNLDSSWQDLSSMVDFSRPIGSRQLAPTAVDDTLYLELTDTTLITQWADTSLADQNNGLFLDFAQATFLQKFFARQTEKAPVLELTYQFPADTAERDTTVSVTVNAFLIDSQFQPEADRDYLVSLDRWVTVLNFDLQKILDENPRGVVITTANVQVGVDLQHTLIDPNFKANFRIVRLESQPDDPQVKADSNFVFFSDREILFGHLIEDSTLLEINQGFERQDFTRTFVRAKLASPSDFTAFLLDVRAPTDFASHFALFKRTVTDPALRPRLILEYWKPPATRF